MEITITQVTPWSRARNAARWTVGLSDYSEVEPTEKFRRYSLMSAHSQKRMVEYDIKIKGIPYYNATHFIRHHVGVEKFQCSLRDDRNSEIDDRKKLPQDYPVNLWIACNAESLLNISYLRLCRMADSDTRNIWEEVRRQMELLDPLVADFMVPQCIRLGFCPEAAEKSCCYVRSQGFRIFRAEYIKHFIHP